MESEVLWVKHDISNSLNQLQFFFRFLILVPLNCLQGSRKSELAERWGQQIRKKLRYFRLLPNLVHRKLIDLANYVPSSSSREVLSFTQRFFKICENGRAKEDLLLGNLWLLLRRMKACIDEFQVDNYKSSKLFWRILEDNKQNKHENRGKKTVWILWKVWTQESFQKYVCVWILRADRRFVWVCSTWCWNAMNSFPLGLRLDFCLQILSYFDELYQQIHVCLSLTR